MGRGGQRGTGTGKESLGVGIVGRGSVTRFYGDEYEFSLTRGRDIGRKREEFFYVASLASVKQHEEYERRERLARFEAGVLSHTW